MSQPRTARRPPRNPQTGDPARSSRARSCPEARPGLVLRKMDLEPTVSIGGYLRSPRRAGMDPCP